MNEIGSRKEDLDTPILWVNLDRLENNIRVVGQRLKQAGVAWRPHIKGVKIPAIAHKLVDAGAIGVTCAKLGEAEVMVAGGIRDILIANQLVGTQKYTRLAHLCRQADVKIAVDSGVTLDDLGHIATETGVKIGVLVELNTGMERAGVLPGEAVLELARQVDQTAGLQFRGLMAWEGHACVEEETDWKHQEIKRAVGQLVNSAEQCRNAGLPCDIVSGGGSGTLTVTPDLAGITEIQAGGAIFNDVMYSLWGVQTDPALYVHVTVTSRPQPERLLIDAGWKTIPAWVGMPMPVGVGDVKSVAMSAEHGNITFNQPNHEIVVGDKLDLMVAYTDVTLFLHDHLYGIRDGIVETIWPIVGRGQLR